MYFLGVLGAIAKFVGILVFSYKFNQTSSVFGGYFSPVVVAMAVAVFVFFKYLNYNKLEKINHFISKLSSLTFGVYLVQYAVIRYYFYNRYNQFSIKVMIIQYVVISITCFTISFLIRKIPKIGKILVP